jgi:hypothetical protein
MLITVVNGSLRLTDINNELRSRTFDGALSLRYERYDMAHTDARRFNWGLPVKHIG